MDKSAFTLLALERLRGAIWVKPRIEVTLLSWVQCPSGNSYHQSYPILTNLSKK